MEDNSLLIAIGVLAGVLTALVLLLASNLWVHTVVPLFRRWRYQGVRISGEWKGLGCGHTPASGEWSEIALTLKQDTVDLHGLMTMRYQSAAQSFELNLQLAGRIVDGYATLSVAPVGKTITSTATALLKIDGGAALNGQLLYRHPFADGVDVINMSVHRAESTVAPRLRAVSSPTPVIRVLQTGTPLAAAALSE